MDFTTASNAGYWRTTDQVANIQASEGVTFSYWLYPRARHPVGEVFVKYGTTNEASWCTLLSQGQYTTGLRSYMRISGAYKNITVTTAQQPLNKWHHWIDTWEQSSGKRRLYRDGLVIKSQTNAGTLSGGTTASNIDLGGRPSYNYHANSVMDDIRIWNRYLPAEEAYQVYENSMRYDDPSLSFLQEALFTAGAAGGGAQSCNPCVLGSVI